MLPGVRWGLFLLGYTSRVGKLWKFWTVEGQTCWQMKFGVGSWLEAFSKVLLNLKSKWIELKLVTLLFVSVVAIGMMVCLCIMYVLYSFGIIRVVSPQGGTGGLPSGWSPIRVSSVRVVFHHDGLPSGRSSIRVISHQGGLLSGWSSIMVVSHQGGLSTGQSSTRVFSHEGGLPSGVPLYTVAIHLDKVSKITSVVCCPCQNRHFQEGEGYQQECQECLCYQGSVRCQLLPCPPVRCSHPVTDGCCPSCTDCLYEGRRYYNGQSLPDRRDVCGECFCRVRAVLSAGDLGQISLDYCLYICIGWGEE